MRRRGWLVGTTALCGVLVGGGFVAVRSVHPSRVVEIDGARLLDYGVLDYGGKRYGPQSRQADPTLEVSRDFARETRRLGFRIPPAFYLGEIRRERKGASIAYTVEGDFSGTAKSLVDAFEKRLTKARRRSRATYDNVSGLGTDGESVLFFEARLDGGAFLGLTIHR